MYKNEISKERQQYLSKIRRNKTAVTLCRILFIVAFIVFWEIGGRLGFIDTFVLSQPSRILGVFADFKENQLLLHIGTTLFETAVGFLLGVVIGCFLAILLWWSPFLSKVSEPYLVILNSLPKIALGPVIIIWAGAGTRAIIFMALAISMIVTVLEMLSGFNNTDKELIRMLKTFKANRLQVFTKIVLPYNIETLFNSLKINIGLSLVGVIAGEFLVSKAGLGYLIVYGGQVFKMDLVMASVLILATAAAILYELIVIAQKLTLKYINHS